MRTEHRLIVTITLAFARRVGADLQLMQVSTRTPVNGVFVGQPHMGCHTSVEGDECYGEVVYAMKTGVVEHPEWYSPLSRSSTFEDFQRHLHGVPKLSRMCPEPCAAQAQGVPVPAPTATTESCHTPVEGDACYQEVLYVMQTDVVQHPDRYRKLSEYSSFEDFQRRLHSVSKICPEPCATQAERVPVAALEPELKFAWQLDACRTGSIVACLGVLRAHSSRLILPSRLRGYSWPSFH